MPDSMLKTLSPRDAFPKAFDAAVLGWLARTSPKKDGH
jgi:hypothetical protein